MPSSPDQNTIRRVVDRVIDELGPGADSDEIRRTAAGVLGRLGGSRGSATVVLADVPAGDGPLPDLADAHWIRSSLDVPAGEPAALVSSAVHRLASLPHPDGRICLTVAPSGRDLGLDWIADLLEREPRLRVALACARPGLGVDSVLVERLLALRRTLDEPVAKRLYAACMRLPVARSGPIRYEVLVPYEGSGRMADDPGTAERLRMRVGDAPISCMLHVSAGLPAVEWLALRRWRVTFGGRPEPVRGIRVSGWPAGSVRPFGHAPLCVAPDGLIPHLYSLACGCSQAPVCLSPDPLPTNGHSS